MRLLFFITKPYSVPVLNPIKDYCDESSGVNTAWFKAGAAKNLEINGLTHYITSGIYENRSTVFDVASYINNNNLFDQFSNIET